MNTPGVSAERFAQLLCETAFEAVSLLDEDGVVRATNDDEGRLVGTRPGDGCEPGTFAEVHPDDLAEARRAWSQILAAPRVALRSCFRMKHPDGSWRWIESCARNLLGDPLVKRVVINWRDVTDRRVLDEQFVQAQKMDAVGRLAGGVAHDLNNLLSIVISATALLQQELLPEHPSQPITEEIRTACRRGAELTRQLLAFSGRQLLVPAPMSVNDLVRATIEEVTPRLAPGITIVTQLDPAVGVIQADSYQLERVLAGLVNNACEAMPAGGELRFSTGNLTVGASDLSGPGVGEYVRLQVEDTGVGMSALTRAQLFEPFFTTKPRGKGVGLALATAYGVIRQSNGHIRVRSEPGEGSSFALLFPRHGAAPAPPPPRLAPTSAPALTSAPRGSPGGTEVILLVEDDHAVRRVTAALLVAKGYRVIQAEGGREALALSDEELGAVGLLLSDVMMPELSGPEIAAALKARRPGLRVLFMSGYHNEALHDVLQKPFTPDALGQRVRELLDQPAA